MLPKVPVMVAIDHATENVCNGVRDARDYYVQVNISKRVDLPAPRHGPSNDRCPKPSIKVPYNCYRITER